MKWNRLLFCILSLCCLVLLKPTSINAAEEKLTDADIAEVYPHKNNTELIVSYILEEKKELILKTNEENVIDLESLEREIGSDKILVDSDKKEFKLTLDKPETISFKLFVNNQKPFTLSILKANGEKIFDYDLNQPEKYSATFDDVSDDEDNIGWNFSEFLRVSEGQIFEHSDGTSTRPYLYFGDYDYAIRKASISESFDINGKSRKNSLTAANSAILYSEPGSRILDGPKGSGNHIYTTHYGDHQKGDFDSLELSEMAYEGLKMEDKPQGAARNFISNNVFNYVVPSDGKGVPGTSGPDKIGMSYAMLETPKFYYRTNLKTGLEEQKMVYKQRPFYVNKKGRHNPEITTTIKLSFNSMGRVVTKITFTNTSKVNPETHEADTFGGFIGFSNQDLSLNKDGKEITDKNGKRIGNYLPLRTLGNKRGMYIQSADNQIRHSIYTNQPNGPAAFAARSTSSSYIATKGYSYNPGLIGIVAFRERYYPWKIGKPQSSGVFGGASRYFNKSKNQFLSPYVPEGLFNAFDDQSDKGDSERKDASGARLGVAEGKPTWDAGITMRTEAQHLHPKESVSMEYTSQTDIKGTTFNPVIELDLQGSDDDPQILPMSSDTLPISGQWYDFDSKDVTMHYSIDSDKEEDYQILFNASQKDSDIFYGNHHEIVNQKISLKGLEKNKHKIRFYMEDKEGHRSPIKEHVIKFVKPATDKPQIVVTSPGSTIKEPHDPIDNLIDLKGYWSDKNSKKIKKITYKIDDGDEITAAENLDNPNLGKLIPWKWKELDIENYNDFETHKIEITIADEDGNEGLEEFYFRHQPGALKLTAPEKIDFGTVAVSQNGSSKTAPQIEEGNVILDDYRRENSGPISVSLSMDTFYKEIEEVHDDSDTGDDSSSIGDHDRVVSPTDSLIHKAYWKNKLVDSNNLIIGTSDGKTSPKWRDSVDFTNEVLKNLKLDFQSRNEGLKTGKYVSHWTWQTVESIQ
ncbi:hypothetical protein COSHB9_03460 [Companilactobacillus alimentarius]|uniref:hypothetical protein n=1 Tax=Companilactobacillus alimentarius TaxID=1602 RepID=UPI000AB5098C|nr:hypothetical protein [Companilactobacillus alimentarius]MDT6953512.1 hypothetical protein [Companilactobacillus alimentarius]GEO44519.1 hypothetical protein LAL01_07510 [Companilactobacillus alimentarius]